MTNTSSSPQVKRSGGTLKAETRPVATTNTLSQWINHSLSQKDTKIIHRLRGNILHILCEAAECPAMETTLQQLKTALADTDINTLPPEISGQMVASPIYQIILYGRKQGHKQADWSVRVDTPSPVPQTTPPPLPEKAPGIENQRQAHQGNPLAIARYLGEILSPFGVGVRVQIRPLKTTPPSPRLPVPLSLPPRRRGSPRLLSAPQKRLWVFCTSAYSPDPVLLVEPLAQRLRHLQLEGFRDALILGQVTGETKPEWLLRIDLTPPEQQLAAWARWGDIPALTRLLEQKLTPLGLKVSGVIEESTLHLFFTVAPNSGKSTSDKETVKACIQPLLETIAPQGIIGATLYGQLAEESPPVWVDWLHLPAGRHVELAATVLERAANGDLEAITFLLERQLNPDLDRKLQSGGMQVTIRRVTNNTQEEDTFHILVDNPVSPPDRAVGLVLAKAIANLNIKGKAGDRKAKVIIYGRVCGRVQPLWRHQVDLAEEFNAKQREILPEPAVDFPPTSPSSPDFLPEPPQTVINSEFSGTVSNSEDLQSFLTKQLPPSRETANPDSSNWLSQLLIATHAFTSAKSSPKATTVGAASLVWFILGLLTLVQADWFFASLLHPPANLSQVPNQAQAETIPLDAASGTLGSSRETDGGVFDNSGFTETATTQTSSAAPTALHTDFAFSYPTFNSQQLDEQLANYLRYVAEGGPADVLIVGSSRALRGVNPVALTAALGTNRPGLRIFNFGINGATAQVVAWLLQDLLAPEYLPKLILWADGARAFNSGRADRTMEAIIASPGYKALQQGKPTIRDPQEATADNPDATAKPKTEKGLNLAAAYDELDAFFASKLTSLSASYEHRSHLLKLLSSKIHMYRSGLSVQPQPTPEAETETGPDLFKAESQAEPEVLEKAQANGFLPISQKFDPYTYYDQYALVTGTYDADYQSFQLLGKQDEALQNIIQLTKERDINLVFINTPLTMGYLDPVRLAYEREFQQYILGLAMKHQFLFKDYSELWPTQNDYFSDPSHLNRFGAAEVSRKLADDALISWPKTINNY